MRKKGFSFAEMMLALTIIGVISVLGYNYVKKKIENYDKLFYYTIYKTLTDGFADAIYNNKSLDNQGLCEHFSQIFSIQSSSCSPTSNQLTLTNDVVIKIGNQQNYYLEGDETSHPFYIIEATTPKNNPLIFYAVQETQEILPITNELITNSYLLPVYLISDYNNNQNKPVAGFISYKDAVCYKDSNNNRLLKPETFIAYTSKTSSDYCSGANTITFKQGNPPAESLTIKTRPPRGYK